MKKISLLLFAFLICFNSLPVWASHIMGGDMYYKNNPNGNNPDVYRVYVKLYYDCTGPATTPLPGPAPYSSLTLTSSCSVQPQLMGGAVFVSYTEITPICPIANTKCTDTTATLDGYLEGVHYFDYDFSSLPNACVVTMKNESCCRNNIITSLNNPGGDFLTLSVTVTKGNPVNNSPEFIQSPVLYICLGQTSDFVHGVLEPDGDSLSYNLVNCISGNSLSVSYAAGYSALQPMGASNPVSLDPHTGTLSITANTLDIGVVCIEVSEWRNQQLIHRTARDIQIQILNCTPNAVPQISPMNNIPGKYSDTINCFQPGPYTYTFQASDTDPGQNLSMIWSQNIAGGVLTVSGTGNSITGTLSFNFLSSGTYHFAIQVKDDACILNAYKTEIYTLTVIQHTNINGTIYNSNQQVIPNCRIYAVYHDPILQTLTAMDSFFSDALGNYTYGSCEPFVFLKATPDATNHPNEIPAYYPSSVLFQNASPVVCPGGTVNGMDIYTQSGPNPGGFGFIGGFIVQGANKTSANPVADLTVFLIHKNSNLPILYTQTDVNGYFSFNLLDSGDFAVWVDHPLTDNTQAPVVHLNLQQIKDSLLFELTPLLLILKQDETSISPNLISDTNPVIIYPNPGKDVLNIQAKIPLKSMEISNLSGQIIKHILLDETNDEYLIDISELSSSGMYLIRLIDRDNRNYQKLWYKL